MFHFIRFGYHLVSMRTYYTQTCTHTLTILTISFSIYSYKMVSCGSYPTIFSNNLLVHVRATQLPLHASWIIITIIHITYIECVFNLFLTMFLLFFGSNTQSTHSFIYHICTFYCNISASIFTVHIAEPLYSRLDG